MLGEPRAESKQERKRRRKIVAASLSGYSRTESFTRIAGFTGGQTRASVIRNRTVLTIIVLILLLTGFYFVLF